jgi:IS30 family transposase
VTLDERSQIYALKSNGFTLTRIAKHLGLSISTVSREIKRNSGQRGYRPIQANELAKERRSTASSQPKKTTPELKKIIFEKLKSRWSPDQISGRLRFENVPNISAKTIYRLIREERKRGNDLSPYLRHRGKPYNWKNPKGLAGRGCIAHRIGIEERPKIVEQKKRIGDWEGDTLSGAHHQGAVVSLVDRATKYCVLAKVLTKCSEEVTRVIIESLKSLPHKVRTMTFDNGKEFSQHQAISTELHTKCFFTNPYCSWEKGLVEHTNGLVRDYLPKKTNLRKITSQKVQLISEALNKRPRKALNYRTPYECFFKESVKLFNSS